jgi:beta-lactamase class A
MILPLLLLAAQAPAAPTVAASPGGLPQRLEAIARHVPGKLGVTVLHLDRGTRAAVRGDVPAPMASVFKLPLAVAVLRRAQEQGIALSLPVHVLWEERNPGWSPLAQRIPRSGLDLSLDALLEAAVSDSDNTAADTLLRWMRGPEEVMRLLRRLGLGGFRIDRSERELAYDLWGLGRPGKPEALETLLTRLEGIPKERRLAAMKRFSADPRDQATPAALVDLLAALEAGRLLDPVHTARPDSPRKWPWATRPDRSARETPASRWP